MKYIRMKDDKFGEKIYELVESEGTWTNNLISRKIIEKALNGNKYFKDIKVITQADAIEELCDFVDIQYFDNSWETYLFEKTFRIKLLFNKAKQVFYGIRTDKGLIYVAKMNKEGELELL